MDTSDFNFIFLGQSVLKYQVPLDVYNTINHIYETKYPELKPANKQLVGKIEKEHSLFCLLYTSPSPRDGLLSRMPSSA